MAPDFENVRRHILIRLAEELSPNLTYHSLFHTRDDVLPAAARLGRAARLPAADCLLLETAALFHDTGFLLSYDDHEEHSVLVARATLPRFGYTGDQVEAISTLIRATKMPQRPRGLLQELLCDADLDLLGRADFIELNRKLLQEIVHYTGHSFTIYSWLTGQSKFLEDHHFFTAPARESGDMGKSNNLALMRATLLSLNGSSHSQPFA